MERGRVAQRVPEHPPPEREAPPSAGCPVETHPEEVDHLLTVNTAEPSRIKQE